MKVFVNSVSSNISQSIDVSPSDSIRCLKGKIEKIDHIKPEDQSLSYRSKPLMDTHNIKDYGIKQGETIQVNARLRGGVKETVKPLRLPTSDASPSKRKGKSKWNNVSLKGVIQDILKPENSLPSEYSSIAELRNFYDFQKKKKIEMVENEIVGYCYHSSAVSAVAIANENEYFATGSEDGTIKLFYFSSYQIFQTFQNLHARAIKAMAISEEDKYLLSGSEDMVLKLLNLETMQIFNTINVPYKDQILSVGFSNDFEAIVATNQRIHVFDIFSGHLIKNIEGSDSGLLSSAAISNDGKYFACVMDQRKIRLLGSGPPQDIHTFNESDEYNTAIAISSDAKFIATGCVNGVVKMFSVLSKQEIHDFGIVHNGTINVIVISNDNNYIVTGSNDSFVRVLDAQNKRQIYLCDNSFKSLVKDIALSRNNQYIVAGCSDRYFRIYPLEHKNKQEEVLENFPKHIYEAVILDEKYIVSIDNGRMIRIFNTDEKKEIAEISIIDDVKAYCMCKSKDEKFIIIGTEYGSLIRFDCETREQVYFQEIAHEKSIIKVALSHNDKWIVSASNDPSIKIFDIESKQLIHNFEKPHEEKDVTAMALTADDKHIISGYQDGWVKIFCLESKQEIYRFEKIHEDDVTYILVTQDNKRIITCSQDGFIKIIDNQSKQIISSFGHFNHKRVTSLALYHQEKYLICSITGPLFLIIDLEMNQIVYKKEPKNISEISCLIVIRDKFLITSHLSGREPVLFHILPYNDDEFYECCLGISTYINAQGHDTAILQQANNPHFLQTYQDLYFLPHNWTILHLLAIFNHESLAGILPYSEMKVPFLIDKYGKTPLHYLLAHGKIDFSPVNSTLEYILDYLEDNYSSKPYQCQEIMDSITNTMPFIISKTSTNLAYRFLQACCRPTSLLHNQTLPKFGDPTQRYIFSEKPIVQSQILNEIYKGGQDIVAFETMTPNFDYDALSDDMLNMTLTLNEIKNEEIFKFQAISRLISHLWKTSKKFHLVNGLVFSVLMALISVNIAQDYRLRSLEIIILILTGYFLTSECVQIYGLRKSYLLNFWNWTDMTLFILIITSTILSFADYEDELTMNWLYAIIIIAGYIRWISYLQIFSATRSLIHLVLVVLKDMWAFLIIVLFIIIGFALIFLEFDREQTYLDHFYATYNLLYNVFSASSYIPTQKILLALILLLLSVVLLNLLISIMGDSFEKLQEKKVLTNAETRLGMILESTIVMRTLFRKKHHKKGYLLFCSAAAQEEDSESSRWEGQINLVKKMIKHRHQKIDKVDQKVNKVGERVSVLEQDFKELKKNVFQNHQEIMAAIKELSKNS